MTKFWLLDYDPKKTSAVLADKMVGRKLPMERNGLSIVLGSSLKDQDLVWTIQSQLLITEKAKDIFEKNKLTGYELRPVTEVGFKNKVQDDQLKLWEIVIQGWAGQAPTESGIKLEKYDPIKW